MVGRTSLPLCGHLWFSPHVFTLGICTPKSPSAFFGPQAGPFPEQGAAHCRRVSTPPGLPEQPEGPHGATYRGQAGGLGVPETGRGRGPGLPESPNPSSPCSGCQRSWGLGRNRRDVNMRQVGGRWGYRVGGGAQAGWGQVGAGTGSCMRENLWADEPIRGVKGS